jgi:hypothetical protein
MGTETIERRHFSIPLPGSLWIFLATVMLAVAPVSVRGAGAQDRSAELEQKLTDLRKAINAGGPPGKMRESLTEILHLLDESLSAGEYALATRVSSLAVAAGNRIGNAHVASVCERRKIEVTAIAKEAKRIAKQFEKLETEKLDPAANFEVGRFKCLFCGDWDHGLPMLARSNNAAWNTAAKHELAHPSDLKSEMEVASDWFRLAVNEKSESKIALSLRARHWWRHALNHSTGDTRLSILSKFEKFPICYLTDLAEAEVVAGPWPLGKDGTIGIAKPVEVNGFRFPLSLGMHPPDGGEASVKYKLNEKWKSFVADVGINDYPEPFTNSVIFTVLGDGQVLWKSDPITSQGVVASCNVSVKGVKTLQLKTTAPGQSRGCHAVWIDAHLLK